MTLDNSILVLKVVLCDLRIRDRKCYIGKSVKAIEMSEIQLI